MGLMELNKAKSCGTNLTHEGATLETITPLAYVICVITVLCYLSLIFCYLFIYLFTKM